MGTRHRPARTSTLLVTHARHEGVSLSSEGRDYGVRRYSQMPNGCLQSLVQPITAYTFFHVSRYGITQREYTVVASFRSIRLPGCYPFADDRKRVMLRHEQLEQLVHKIVKMFIPVESSRFKILSIIQR